MKIFFDIIGSLALSISTIYVISKIMGFSFQKIGLIRYIIAVLALSFYLIISYYSTMIFLRYLLFILAITFIIVIFFKASVKETIVASAFTWILSVISELIFAIIVVYILNMNTESFYGMLIGNISISLILFVIIKIPKLENLLKKFLIKIVEWKKYYSIVLMIILSLSISIIVYINYFNTSTKFRFILSLTVIIIYFIITMILFNEKSNSNRMQYEYENVLNNLNEYETMLDYQKVTNHENKNQLLVIKGMIKKGDKNLEKYIDSIILEKKEDDEDFLYKTNIIPSGGLRGLVYYKILSMKEKNVNVSLNINNKIRKVNLEKMGINMNKDLCKIIGVILDNAIQAVENLKQKNIDIEMNCNDKEMIIIVSNNFEGNLDLGKIDSIGYTTKGAGHGYGLALMKKLIEKNSVIENKKNIYGNTFSQKIIVKISNNN